MLVIVAPGQGAQTPGFLTPWLEDPSFAERLAELIARSRAIGATGARSLAAGHRLNRLVVQAHIFARRSRSAFPTTETELKLIAAAAITGESNSPKNG